jgi:large subunit ribosomal protein L23
MSPEQIIKRPIALTEKATLLRASNQLIFEVDTRANKIQIRDAVETLFNVKVEDVNTLVQRGKTRRVGRRETRASNWKKAIVTLRAGDDIQFLSDSEEEAKE